jgi:phosphoribosyl-ATP pyrophosphohydrolase/phosphoribosyl-AMP cyclohydrolase
MMRGKNVMDRTVRTTRDLDGLEFWENGLLPVVTQDAVTGEVLMVAFANREALEQTLETGEMHYWSRSRKELWHKGATSGNHQRLVSLHRDCDSDTLLARVHPLGPACHTGERSCFGSLDVVSPLPGATGNDDGSGEEAPSRPESTLPEIWALLRNREKERPRDSYTVKLLEDENLRLKKLGEETVELVLALARHEEERIAEEGADLVYHLLVALLASGVELDDLLQELEKRKR